MLNESSHGYHGRFFAQVRSRKTNDGAIIENPLAHMTDYELEEDVRQFAQNHLPSVRYEDILRAARVAKDIRLYDSIAWRPGFELRNRLPVHLTAEEKEALRRERDVAFSEKGMWVVIATVSLAALLQGFVQLSFNGASIFLPEWGFDPDSERRPISGNDWRLGVANASPWFFAAIVGCPLSLPSVAAHKLLAQETGRNRRRGVPGACELHQRRICDQLGAHVLRQNSQWHWDGRQGREHYDSCLGDCRRFLAWLCYSCLAALGCLWHHAGLRL